MAFPKNRVRLINYLRSGDVGTENTRTTLVLTAKKRGNKKALVSLMVAKAKSEIRNYGENIKLWNPSMEG